MCRRTDGSCYVRSGLAPSLDNTSFPCFVLQLWWLFGAPLATIRRPRLGGPSGKDHQCALVLRSRDGEMKEATVAALGSHDFALILR